MGGSPVTDDAVNPSSIGANAASRQRSEGQLRRRLLKWSLLIALAPMLVLAVQGYHCARSAVLDAATERLAQLTDSRRQRLEMWLAERRADAEFLADCPTVRYECQTSQPTTGATADTSAFLALFASRYGDYEAVALYSPGWRELASSGTDEHGLGDFGLSGVIEGVKASTHAAIGSIHRHEDGRLGMHFGAPVLGPDRVASGYVLTAVDETALKSILTDGEPPDSIYRCYLASRDGLLLTEPDRARSGAALTERIRSVGFVRGAGGEAGAAVYSDHFGREVVGGFAQIPGMDWVLLLEQDASEALAWLPELGWRAAITALLVAACVIFLALRGARRLSAPLQQLADVAYRVSMGDHEARAQPVAEPEVNAVGTALNHMLDELARARQRAVHSETLAAMGEMSSAVVHEMRNPLSSIKLNLHAIRARLGDDPRHLELASIAQDQVTRLERMFTDVLSLSRPLAMTYRVMPLRDAIVDAMEAVADQASKKRCRFRFQEADADVRVRLDPERFRQALVNLFQNAIEMTESGGEVTVVTSLDRPRRRVALDIVDEGPGIPEDNLDRLFQPFFTTRPNGTGLGLAIVRKIVEYHDGQVSASNRAGPAGTRQGAVFRIELPHEFQPE